MVTVARELKADEMVLEEDRSMRLNEQMGFSPFITMYAEHRLSEQSCSLSARVSIVVISCPADHGKCTFRKYCELSHCVYCYSLIYIRLYTEVETILFIVLFTGT